MSSNNIKCNTTLKAKSSVVWIGDVAALVCLISLRSLLSAGEPLRRVLRFRVSYYKSAADGAVQAEDADFEATRLSW
jgi:hypothetical protein